MAIGEDKVILALKNVFSDGTHTQTFVRTNGGNITLLNEKHRFATCTMLLKRGVQLGKQPLTALAIGDACGAVNVCMDISWPSREHGANRRCRIVFGRTEKDTDHMPFFASYNDRHAIMQHLFDFFARKLAGQRSSIGRGIFLQ